MSAPPLASARLSKLWIPFLNHIEIYVNKILWFTYFFWFSITILSYTLILTVSQLQTQHLMTSQIRSHIRVFNIQTYNILAFILYLKLIKNVASIIDSV